MQRSLWFRKRNSVARSYPQHQPHTGLKVTRQWRVRRGQMRIPTCMKPDAHADLVVGKMRHSVLLQNPKEREGHFGYLSRMIVTIAQGKARDAMKSVTNGLDLECYASFSSGLRGAHLTNGAIGLDANTNWPPLFCLFWNRNRRTD